MIELKKFSVLLFYVIFLLCGCTKKKIYIPDEFAVSGEISLTFFDMENGASVLVGCRETNILIGCGGAEDFPALYEYLRTNGITKLDTVILPGDAGYAGGFQKIMANFEVKDVYVPEELTDVAKYRTVTQLASENGNFYIAGDGTRIYEMEGLYIDVVSSGVYNGEAFLSLYISYGDTSFLLEGNGDLVAERELVSGAGELMRSDVFAVPHCGTEYLPSEDLLEIVKPAYVVIPVYGEQCPQLTLQKRLSQTGAEVLRTDTNGDVTFVSDGKNIKCYHKKH